MRRRISSIALLAVLSLVLMGLSAFMVGSTAQAGAPPRTPSSDTGPAFQQPKSLPSGPGGVWAIMSQLPGTRVHLPEPQSSITQPARIKRAGAVVFPPNGKIYLLGGRMGIDGEDNPTSNNGNGNCNLPWCAPIGPSMPPYAWLFEYSPASGPDDPGSWVRKQADIDPCPGNVPANLSVQCPGERYTSNMAVAALTNSEGTFIYAVGGSSVNSVPATTVRRYDPVADSISNLVTDPWPASPARIPGGYAVLYNKLYIFGGFDPRGSGTMYGDTWVFDPTAPAGSRWSPVSTANLATPRAYIAGVDLDGYIYAVGGDTWQTHSSLSQRRLVPSNVVERLDLDAPVPTWQPVASLPEPKGDLGAWAYDTGTGFGISGKLVVAGGHSNPPDSSNYLVPDNRAYKFDPPSKADPDGAWTPFVDLTYPTRNFGYVAHNGSLYAIGGYDYSTGKPDSAGFTQRFDATGPIPTMTPIPTATNTSTPTSTSTPTNTVTGTQPTSTPTGTVTNTPVATATGCPSEFRDVAAGSTFYPFVRCLACKGVVAGYPCGGPGEPCNRDDDPYFRPGSNITRGQIAKIVSESARLDDKQDERFYEDVPLGSPFYNWINRLSWRGYMGGYACGTVPDEPCGDDNLPYFRPNANATRGQLSKIVTNAAQIEDAVSGRTYADVPASSDPSSFYVYIERLTQRSVMGGYACGTSDPNSGPCDEHNRPYFRHGNLVTRGQAAKIVANTFFPNCQTP